jgi:hypothetical protein
VNAAAIHGLQAWLPDDHGLDREHVAVLRRPLREVQRERGVLGAGEREREVLGTRQRERLLAVGRLGREELQLGHFANARVGGWLRPCARGADDAREQKDTRQRSKHAGPSAAPHSERPEDEASRRSPCL